MKVIVKQVEGKTNRKGAKQNQVFTIKSKFETEGFFYAVSESNKEYCLWNVRGDWSLLGISKLDKCRTSYTKDFIIEY